MALNHPSRAAAFASPGKRRRGIADIREGKFAGKATSEERVTNLCKKSLSFNYIWQDAGVQEYCMAQSHV